MKFITFICVFVMVFHRLNANPNPFNPFSSMSDALTSAKDSVVKRVTDTVSDFSISLPTSGLTVITNPLVNGSLTLIDFAESALKTMKNFILKSLDKTLNATNGMFDDMSLMLAKNSNSPKYKTCSVTYNDQIKEQSNKSARTILDCGLNEVASLDTSLVSTRDILLSVNEAIATGKFSLGLAMKVTSYTAVIGKQAEDLATLQTRVEACIPIATAKVGADATVLGSRIAKCLIL